jgi:hypothetical protein
MRRCRSWLLAIEDDPSFPTPYRYLAAFYAHMGRFDGGGAAALNHLSRPVRRRLLS